MIIRPETIEFLGENTGSKRFDISISIIFFNMSPPEENESKHKQMELHQIKYCTAKETISKIKRQSMAFEKIFSNNKSDKGINI